MNSDANFYCDPNAFPQKVKTKSNSQKVDLNHIEKVMYPQPYENISNRFEKDNFTTKQEESKPQRSSSGFDISKLMPLLTSGGNLNSLLPKLLGNLGVNADLLSLFNNFKPVKKVESKVVENFDGDSISKYRKVEK